MRLDRARVPNRLHRLVGALLRPLHHDVPRRLVGRGKIFELASDGGLGGHLEFLGERGVKLLRATAEPNLRAANDVPDEPVAVGDGAVPQARHGPHRLLPFGFGLGAVGFESAVGRLGVDDRRLEVVGVGLGDEGVDQRRGGASFPSSRRDVLLSGRPAIANPDGEAAAAGGGRRGIAVNRKVARFLR